jgi:hypothetical protein
MTERRGRGLEKWITAITAAGDLTLTERTWVLLTESPEGGWSLNGQANTNADLVAAARAQIAKLQEHAPGA